MEKNDLDYHVAKEIAVDSWRIFRILAEFVDGFEIMLDLGPSVSFFGSARTKPGDKYYELTTEVSKRIVANGFAVITGGGPGIMEAANKGAKLANGKSCGLSIDLPHEYRPNNFIDDKYNISFRHFFVRKVLFVRYAQGFVVMPGGLGTLDELFEALTLIQTGKTNKFPIYLVGKSYWNGLVEWLKEEALGCGHISKKDLDLFIVTDDPNEVANGIKEHYSANKIVRNF